MSNDIPSPVSKDVDKKILSSSVWLLLKAMVSVVEQGATRDIRNTARKLNPALRGGVAVRQTPAARVSKESADVATCGEETLPSPGHLEGRSKYKALKAKYAIGMQQKLNELRQH